VSVRRRTLILATALAVALAASAPALALNPQSAGLQVALRFQGLYSGPIDGLVGPQTVHALRAFQRREGLPVTGLADVKTRIALGPLGSPLFGRRPLHRGMLGWDVAVLQFLLSRQHLAVPVTGWFDGATAKALSRYQARVKLTADQVAGRATFAALGLQTNVPVPVERVAVRITLRRYAVRPGDNLTQIAGKARTTIAELARLNHLDVAKPIVIGTKLLLPLATKPAASSSADPNVAAVRASIDRWSAAYHVDPKLARALAWMESGYQERVVSSVGAVGVMQLLPVTWDYVTGVLIGHSVPRTADGNVRVGVRYLRQLLNDFNGNKRLALAAWYQGEKSVRTIGLYDDSKTFVANVLALRSRM
jgi:soluble lytic murein transglycosylase-like protein